MSDELRSFIRSYRAEGVSENTVYAYVGAVVSLGKYLLEHDLPTDMAAIRREHVEAWQISLRQRYKPATVHQRFRGAQRFFNWYTAVLDDDDGFRSPMSK